MILGKSFIFLASLFFFEEAINVMFDDVLERQGRFLIFQDVVDRKQSLRDFLNVILTLTLSQDPD